VSGSGGMFFVFDGKILMFSVGLIFWFWSINFDCCCVLVCFLGGAGDRAGFVNAYLLGPTSSGFSR
jgi:hypothetical protein